MKVVIIKFPGTNCDEDTKYAFDKLGFKCEIINHKQDKFCADLVVLPGGFSYGDYLRTAAISKFSPAMSEVLKGKSIIVVDDSIVRGTTSKKIVELLKHAGAKEVHLKIAAPRIKFPDVYGIDTPTKSELISANLSDDEILKYTGADSLEFLEIDELKNAIGNEREYSLVSFDGNYFVK